MLHCVWHCCLTAYGIEQLVLGGHLVPHDFVSNLLKQGRSHQGVSVQSIVQEANLSRWRPPRSVQLVSCKHELIPPCCAASCVCGACCQAVLPCAEYYKRQGFSLKKVVDFAANRDYSDLLVFNEDRKEVRGDTGGHTGGDTGGTQLQGARGLNMTHSLWDTQSQGNY